MRSRQRIDFALKRKQAIVPDPVHWTSSLLSLPDLSKKQLTPVGHSITRVQESWDKGWRGATEDGQCVPLVVLDTGCDAAHEDLASQFGKTPIRMRGLHRYVGGIDITHPGRITWPWDRSRYHPRRWSDRCQHGTHCAGIAAAADNEKGIVGIAPDAELHMIRVFYWTPRLYLTTDDKTLAAAIDWMVKAGDRLRDYGIYGGVATFSGGTRGRMGQIVQDAAARAVGKGWILLAAAGNDGHGVNMPARWPEFIAVGSMDANKRASEFTSRGKELDVVHVGEEVLSTVPGGYRYMTGTSMATPALAGFFALVKGKNMGLKERYNTYAAREDLEGATDPIGDLRNPEKGMRIVNSPRLASVLEEQKPRRYKRTFRRIKGRDIELVVS